MFSIIGWILYGLFVGSIAKLLHSGTEPAGWLGTLLVGIAGSFIGGFLSWAFHFGTTPYEPAGIFVGILGGLVACWTYQYYQTLSGK